MTIDGMMEGCGFCSGDDEAVRNASLVLALILAKSSSEKGLVLFSGLCLVSLSDMLEELAPSKDIHSSVTKLTLHIYLAYAGLCQRGLT